jgi:sulfonate transport system ATP-binding protein
MMIVNDHSKVKATEAREEPSHDGQQLRVVVHNKCYPLKPILLKGIDVSVDCGEIVGLLGASGGGKTTLLRIIAGLDLDFDGAVTVGGITVRGPGLDRSLVFQESRLFPWMRVDQNVAFALPLGLSKQQRIERVEAALKSVDLLSVQECWPNELSGGMEKRVALARALVHLPKVLLLDEPFAALDPYVRFALQDELATIHSRTRLTTLLVTHDVDEAAQLCDRVLILGSHPGRIINEVRIELRRPRQRASEEVSELRRRLLKELIAASSVF